MSKLAPTFVGPLTMERMRTPPKEIWGSSLLHQAKEKVDLRAPQQEEVARLVLQDPRLLRALRVLGAKVVPRVAAAAVTLVAATLARALAMTVAAVLATALVVVGQAGLLILCWPHWRKTTRYELLDTNVIFLK